GDFRRGLRRRCRVAAGDEDVNVAADLLRGRDDMEGGGLQRSAVVLGDQKRRHGQITLASLRSLATSSATSATLPPPLRFGGSTTLSVAIRGWTSTPSAAGVVVSSGFFFAFMMFGSVAYRGSFRRKSVVTTAGNPVSTVSSPPSTSRFTVARSAASSTFDAKVACGQPSSAASI